MKTRSELTSARDAVLSAVPAESRVLCAVSGGLDSMCLLHFMHTWGSERGYAVTAAHFNHQLRPGTSDRDEAFVRDVCRQWGVPLSVGREDVRTLAKEGGWTLEEAGRRARYAFLTQTARDTGCAAVLTAHHADDQAETVLLNLVRGAGIRGLAGIPPERDGILRPFLDVTRAELEAYAAAHGFAHVEDETNADPDAAARNLLRLKIVPLLKELNPRAVEHIAHTAAVVRTVDAEMEDAAGRCLARAVVRPGCAMLELRELDAVPPAVLPRIFLELFDRLGVGRKDVGEAHVESLRRLCRSRKRDARISLPHGVTGRVSASCLVLETLPPVPAPAQLAIDIPLRWGRWLLTLREYRAGDGLALRSEGGPITVAPVRPGDRLLLPGSNGARTVRRLCLDRGIPLAERDSLPAFYEDGRLLAVWRLGADASAVPGAEDPVRFIQILDKTEESRYDQ